LLGDLTDFVERDDEFVKGFASVVIGFPVDSATLNLN